MIDYCTGAVIERSRSSESVINVRTDGEARRARLADTLIAQSCVDHRAPRITRDSDFRHFAKHAALQRIEL